MPTIYISDSLIVFAFAKVGSVLECETSDRSPWRRRLGLGCHGDASRWTLSIARGSRDCLNESSTQCHSMSIAGTILCNRIFGSTVFSCRNSRPERHTDEDSPTAGQLRCRCCAQPLSDRPCSHQNAAFLIVILRASLASSRRD